MAAGLIGGDSSPMKSKYENEIGCHIEAIRGMNGTASGHLERLRSIANDVLGHEPARETAADPTAPRGPANGLLQELKQMVMDLNETVNQIGLATNRLDKLH